MRKTTEELWEQALSEQTVDSDVPETFRRLVIENERECAEAVGEMWADISGFEGLYQVSTQGRVRNKSGVILKPHVVHGGYWQVGLWKNGKVTNAKLHRSVAAAFIENPDNLGEVNHLNGDKNDNSVSNLAWCNRSENMRHAVRALGVGGPHGMKPITATHIETGQVLKFDSIEEAGRNGFCRSSIYKVCHGHRPQHNGYTWAFDSMLAAAPEVKHA